MRNVKTPRFQQRHYEYLASEIRRYAMVAEHEDEWLNFVTFLIPVFKADNPKFDRDRFLRACEPKP